MASTLVLIPTNSDPTTKEQSRKRGTVGANGADGIDMILTLLEGLLGGLRVPDNYLDPEGTNPCRTSHRPKVFLDVPDGSCGGDWISYIGMRPLVWGSLHAHLNRRFWLIVRFCKSEMPLLRSRVWYRLTELLQTG